MKTFYFKDKIPLDFEGRCVFLALETAKEKIEESLKTVIPECQAIIEKGENSENLAECTEKLGDFISGFIGKENFSAIFENRKINFYDLCDIYRYICEEVKAFADEKSKPVKTGAGVRVNTDERFDIDG